MISTNLMSKFSKVFSILAIATLFSGCGNDDGTATLQVALIDAPADFRAVNIDVQDVQINAGTDDEGFSSLENVSTGVFDILQLTAGLEAILADVELPAGRLSQIRLILGDNNELVYINEETDTEETQELTVPSGSQSGLKLNVNVDMEAGITYKILLDFDAAKSIVKAGGSGKYNLKPVIRTTVEATSGAISGAIDPVVNATVVAIDESGSEITTSFTNENGEFLLRGLPAGNYTLRIDPDTESGLSSVTTDPIAVEIGVVADAGTITVP